VIFIVRIGIWFRVYRISLVDEQVRRVARETRSIVEFRTTDWIDFSARRALLFCMCLNKASMYTYILLLSARSDEKERKRIFYPDVIFPLDSGIFLTDEKVAHCWLSVYFRVLLKYMHRRYKYPHSFLLQAESLR
jgi:hypothetical protein